MDSAELRSIFYLQITLGGDASLHAEWALAQETDVTLFVTY
jgi:hypothetical protein